MRSLIISFTVIMFCLAINIVNQVDQDYFTDSGGKFLFGWTVGEAPLSVDSLSEYSNDNLNVTASGFINPTEQPEGLAASGFFDDVVKKLSMLNFLWNTLVYSTVGFHTFLYTLGRPESGMVWVPLYIGIPLSILVNINDVLLRVQFIRGVAIEN